MKIDDLGKLNEGLGSTVGNWVARKGLLGAQAGLAAQKEYNRAGATKQMAATFVQDFQHAFDQAKQSGAIDFAQQTPGTPPPTNPPANPAASNPATQTPAQIRQQKQAAAAKVAQNQMAANPASNGSGAVKGIKSNVDISKLQKFNGIVDVSPKINPPPQVKDAKGNVWTKTSAGWTNGKREIDRGDSTYLSFDDAWRTANGAQPGNSGVVGSQQPAPTQQAPVQQPQINKQKVKRAPGGRRGRKSRKLREGAFNDFNEFDTLLENLVNDDSFLIEGVTPEEFAKDYIDGKIHGMNVGKYQSTLDTLIKTFGQEARTKQQFPAAIANKIYSIVSTIGATQKRDAKGNVVGATTPASGTPPTGQPSTPPGQTPPKKIKNTKANTAQLVGAFMQAATAVKSKADVATIDSALVSLGALLLQKNPGAFNKAFGNGDLGNRIKQAVAQSQSPQNNP